MGFLVIDETWKLFSQTGNIEAYLLLKELERDYLDINSRGDEEISLQTEL